MCGIVGFYASGWEKEERVEIARACASAIASRGPDDSGVWAEEKGLTLAHRRLAILDLSPSGHQPMRSEESGSVIVFNGEIYNFKEIREELEKEGHHFRSTGDTEVLLKAIDHFGLEETVKKCNGMFALGVWDPRERVFQIARDRLGIKPLYYGWWKEGFVFASELKALFSLKGFSKPLSEEALSLFFEHGYITAPYSIFKDIFKLPPGCTLTLREAELSRTPHGFSPFPCTDRCTPLPFWSVPKEGERFQGSYEEGVSELERLLLSSIQYRCIADVPLGAFLSGGIDSSTVVALMKRLHAGHIKTFSIGFEEKQFNEAPYAKEIANHLKTDHTELYIPAKEALDLIPELTQFYDEPFADSSQIPTVLVSRLAREHVTVSLSGDGGDELFKGYTRYPIAIGIWRKLQFLPHPLRSVFAALLRSIPMNGWNALYEKGQWALPRSFRGMKYVGLKAHRLSEVLSAETLGELYCTANTHWRPAYHPVSFLSGETALTNYELEKEFSSSFDYLSYLDLKTYLPDDILTKVDRASMSCALEARVPLLDHRIVEFSRTLPEEWCVYEGVQKRILRDVLKKHVPEQMFERPKTGFGVPLPEWLREELKEWGESLLSKEKLPEGGVLKRDLIMDRWQKHQERKIDFHYPLWNVLQFQAWKERWKNHIG